VGIKIRIDSYREFFSGSEENWNNILSECPSVSGVFYRPLLDPDHILNSRGEPISLACTIGHNDMRLESVAEELGLYGDGDDDARRLALNFCRAVKYSIEKRKDISVELFYSG